MLASKTTEVKYTQKGERGMLPYPAGEYSESVSYMATANVTPYVLFNGLYYVMNKVGTWLGTAQKKTPAEDYALNGQNATWIPFEEYKAIFVELLFANFAKLGSFIFNGDIQMSQQGTLDGAASSDYTNPSFQPNYQVNALTGKVDAKDMNISGGTIGGFVVTDYSIGDKAQDGEGPLMSLNGYRYQWFDTDTGGTTNSYKIITVGNIPVMPTSPPFNTPLCVYQKLSPADYHGYFEAGAIVKVSGGQNRNTILFPPGTYYARQVGLKVETDNGDDDFALDIKGRVRVGEQQAYTGGIGFQHVWDESQGRFRLCDVIFQDGLCVGYNLHD